MKKSATISTIIALILFLYTTNIYLNDPISGSTREGIHVFNFFMWFTIPIILWLIYFYKSSQKK
jgi:hypothetical protein